MGGNIWNTPRKSKEEYLDIQKDVVEKLALNFKKPLLTLDFFENKHDFGDDDILTMYPLIDINKLMEVFSLEKNEVKQNHNIVSFKYRDFQIDLCHFSPEHLQTAYNYMRMGDLSNMIGVIVNRVSGFSYTHKGLYLPIYLNESERIGEVFVSDDTEKILSFFDFDYPSWKKGFKNQEDAFNWITRSKFFNKEFFLFENLNHRNRTRNRKRKMYSEFVEWSKDRSFENNFIRMSRQYFTWNAAIFFRSNFLEKVQEIIDERIKFEDTRNSLNGHDIMKITGYSGVELGRFISGFKEFLKEKADKHNYIDAILSFSKEQLINFVKEYNNERYKI